MRTIKPEITENPYFSAETTAPTEDGTRQLNPIGPYIISGGQVTERCYFENLSKCTKYKFNILPKFFGNEASYAEVFPRHINDILSGNPDAKIYCVFDLDTIYGNLSSQKDAKRKCAVANKKTFEAFKKNYTSSKNVVLCPSMPCFEYWFLLHFENDTTLYKTCGKVIKKLDPYMRGFFPDNKLPNEYLFKMKKTKNIDKIKLVSILKTESYLCKDEWVKKLCANGKLEKAIRTAEENINCANDKNLLEQQSYSYVFLPFKNYDIDTTGSENQTVSSSVV